MESKENKEQIEEKFQAKLQGLLEMAKKKKMVIEDTEISISLYDGEDFTIEFNHFRSIKGFFDKDDHIEIKENTLNLMLKKLIIKLLFPYPMSILIK